MELLYFTTAISSGMFEEIVRTSSYKPSAAPQTFESNLIKGIKNIESVNLSLFSFPMVATFPSSKFVAWGQRYDEVCGITTRWIPTINLAGLKQLTIRLSSYYILKQWLNKVKNTEDKCVIIYSVYLPIVKNIAKLCKKNGCKSVCIVTDLPRDMYANRKAKGLKKLMCDYLTKQAIKVQSDFWGYVYLTKHMREVVNDKAPYIVVEGIGESRTIKHIQKQNKVVMYAGTLNKRFGIDIILKAFLHMNSSYTLWIFGSGDYEKEVREYAEKCSNIVFWGRRPRNDILEYEMQASLLVNVRSADDDYTKYSFPSKMIEYMQSGTPLLTSRLEGIPDEYYQYVYVIDEVDEVHLADKLREIFADDGFATIGTKAREFIENNKNEMVQAKRIIELIRSENNVLETG